MATKAEDVRASAQKKGPSKKKAKKLVQRKPKRSHAEPVAAGRKATYAKETTAKGKRPSRKSTRASANRAKADSTIEIRSELAKNAPTERARSVKRKARHPRGKKA